MFILPKVLLKDDGEQELVFGKYKPEDIIERENTFNMEQFSASVNEFLSFRRYKILPDKGHISAQQAKEKAEAEYDIFNRTQHIDSDFDKEIRGMIEGKEK